VAPLWRDGGFAPDFMLWLKRGQRQVLELVDPKGFARQWPVDKVRLQVELEARPLSVPVRGALLSVSAPDAAALPPGQRRPRPRHCGSTACCCSMTRTISTV
jgi:hypothetical protein